MKAEPVEIIDSDDNMAYDQGGGGDAGMANDTSEADFTEEKFSGGGDQGDANSLWGAGGDASADLFSQVCVKKLPHILVLDIYCFLL